MNVILFIAGSAIILLAVYDLLYTTFAPKGAGPVTTLLTTWLWKLIYALRKITGSTFFLEAAGIVIICNVLIKWIIMIWSGCALIYIASPESVVNSTTQAAAGITEKVYFSGYILSTMGNGDFAPGPGFWKIFTALISFTGLVLITIAVTYIVPVISAHTERRSLSIELASLGNGPQDILLKHWNGQDFKKMEPILQTFTDRITKQGQQQLAYPILHYFYSKHKHHALLPTITALDEALSVLLLHVAPDKRPGFEYLYPVRKAITSFLESLVGTYVKVTEEDVPPLKVDLLEAAGLPLMQSSAAAAEHLAYRRRILKLMMDNDGWDWDSLTEPSSNQKYDLLFRY